MRTRRARDSLAVSQETRTSFQWRSTISIYNRAKMKIKIKTKTKTKTKWSRVSISVLRLRCIIISRLPCYSCGRLSRSSIQSNAMRRMQPMQRNGIAAESAIEMRNQNQTMTSEQRRKLGELLAARVLLASRKKMAIKMQAKAKTTYSIDFVYPRASVFARLIARRSLMPTHLVVSSNVNSRIVSRKQSATQQKTS